MGKHGKTMLDYHRISPKVGVWGWLQKNKLQKLVVVFAVGFAKFAMTTLRQFCVFKMLKSTCLTSAELQEMVLLVVMGGRQGPHFVYNLV